jgi:hypothetical protein
MAGVVRRPRAVRCLIPGPSHPIRLSACVMLIVSADRKQTSNTIAICERIINGRFIITTRRMQLLTLMPLLLICQCKCHSINLAKMSYSASGLQHCKHAMPGGAVRWIMCTSVGWDSTDRKLYWGKLHMFLRRSLTLLIACLVIMVDMCIRRKVVTRLSA